MSPKDIPNIISVARVVLTIPVAYFLLEERFAAALMLFFVAGVSDGLDGYLAKRFGWYSRLGSILDPLADKALLVTSFLCLAWVGLIPFWLLALVMGRDVIIVLGGAAYHWLIGRFEMSPTWVSKLNTTLQIALVLLVVFSNGVYALPDMLIIVLVYSVCITTILSGLDYVWTWGRKAVQARHIDHSDNHQIK